MRNYPLYPFSDRIPVLGTYENSAESVQTPQNAASDQDLHFFLRNVYANTIKVKIFTRNPRTTNGLIRIVRMAKPTGQKRIKMKGK